VNHGLKRLAACQLFNVADRRVIRAALLEFLVHGLRYVFPTEIGYLGRGMPTGASVGQMAKALRLGDDDRMVWATPAGASLARGRVIAPLYKTAPLAAAKDPALHELLALADALRIGRARERALARDELTKRLAS
jgi:hypothetical protein